MAGHLTRGELLFARGRYEEAEAELRKALAQEPEEPDALALLALAIANRGRLDEALSTAHQAVGCGPDLPSAHYAVALVYMERDELLNAKAAIDEALRLDPEDADCWATLASIRAAREEFQEALAAARRGLAVDPEHDACGNMKALALTQLGRHAEAAATIEGQLARDPDDSLAHANRGFADLHAGKPREAAEHFREALRLDPESEFARMGMLHALGARNPVYRVLMAYFLWTSRLGSGARWGVIIGGYALYRVLVSLSKHSDTLFYWTMPLIVVYLLFIFLTWSGTAFSNLLLRLDAFGRFVLSREEMRASNFVGGSLVVAVALGLAALLTREPALVIATILFFVMIIPLSAAFNADATRGRTTLVIYTAILYVLGLATVALAFVGPNAAALPAILFMLGFLGFTWVANVIASKKPE